MVKLCIGATKDSRKKEPRYSVSNTHFFHVMPISKFLTLIFSFFPFFSGYSQNSLKTCYLNSIEVSWLFKFFRICPLCYVWDKWGLLWKTLKMASYASLNDIWKNKILVWSSVGTCLRLLRILVLLLSVALFKSVVHTSECEKKHHDV